MPYIFRNYLEKRIFISWLCIFVWRGVLFQVIFFNSGVILKRCLWKYIRVEKCCVECLSKYNGHWNYSPTNVTTSNESCWETTPFPLITRIIHVACFLDQNNFVLTTSHTHLAVVKIGSPFTQAGTDSCLTGNLMVSSFDLKNIAKTQLEELLQWRQRKGTSLVL